ncbi:hypothetical protein HDV00_003083 [Rhizophlyctis rosea]|nr:hypothetical protein HDV00_003083 [Rhizophlyctis rosea]
MALAPEQVEARAGISKWQDKDLYRPSYNVAPTRFQPVIRRDKNAPGKDKFLQSMKWGLVPSWTKTTPTYQTTMHTINARDDTVIEGRMWSSMKQTKRCIVIAEGFFEWQKKGKERKPFFVTRADGELMTFAGLWDHAVIDEKEYWTYTIVTTNSSSALSFLHDRMPVILTSEEDIDMWLDPDLKFTSKVASLMRPLETGLKWTPVSSFVSKVGNDSPECIQPADSKEATKGTLLNFFKSPTKGSEEKRSVEGHQHSVAEKEEKAGEEGEQADIPSNIWEEHASWREDDATHAASGDKRKRDRVDFKEEEETKSGGDGGFEACPLCGQHIPQTDLEQHVHDELQRMEEATKPDADGLPEPSPKRLKTEQSSQESQAKGREAAKHHQKKAPTTTAAANQKGIEKFFKPTNPQ